jgi:hypothetical protein
MKEAGQAVLPWCAGTSWRHGMKENKIKLVCLIQQTSTELASLLGRWGHHTPVHLGTRQVWLYQRTTHPGGRLEVLKGRERNVQSGRRP